MDIIYNIKRGHGQPTNKQDNAPFEATPTTSQYKNGNNNVGCDFCFIPSRKHGKKINAAERDTNHPPTCKRATISTAVQRIRSATKKNTHTHTHACEER